MAVTYRGTAQSLTIVGNDAAAQNLFVIANGVQSRVNVIVRELTVANDATAVLTSVMSAFKVSRCTAVSGGVTLAKAAYVGTETSDANVVLSAQANETATITATPGDVLWTQLAGRMHTAVEQQRFGDSGVGVCDDLIPPVARSVGNLTLAPGQSLLVRLVAATAASNAQTAQNYVVRCTWEEDALTTFAISGTVTLSAVPVDGAKVMVVEADDIALTNAHLRAVITTAGGGLWASTIRTGKIGAAFVQYENGGTYYTAPGSPFLSA